MATAPYGVRLIVGAAVTVVDQTRRLPQTVLMYPMTLASSAAQLVMRVQQDIAVLLVRGDEALETIFPARDEQPEWATFDEDFGGEDGRGVDDLPSLSSESDQRFTEGRFALYSSITAGDTDEPPAGDGDAAVEAPAVVADLDYANLTLAQLRARLRSLAISDLDALLSYEIATKGRAPFQTLLANRITRASAAR